MSLPYIQSTMSSVRAGGESFISRPFLEDGDTDTKVYSMACSQLADDYDSEQLDLDDTMTSAVSAGVIALPFAADSNAYFVGDTGHTAADGSMIEFQRTFANIPKYTRVPTGSQNYSFPGWGEAAFYNQSGNITVTSAGDLASLKASFSSISTSKDVISASYSWPSNILTITAAYAHTLTAGDYAFINLSYTISGDPTIHHVSSGFNVISTPSAFSITVDLGRIFTSQQSITIISGAIRSSSLDTRSATSQNSPTITETTYILPGVTPGFSTVNEVGIPPKFAVMDTTTGVITTMASYITTPTKADYKAMVSNKAQIVIEASVEEWMGNIVKQTVKTIRAV
jgi:hypothetical protein